MKGIPWNIRRKGVQIAVAAVILICLMHAFGGLHGISYASESGEDGYENGFKRILILNSYDEGYRWTSEQSDAIIERVREEFDDILIFVEYMDTKYHPKADNLRQLYELYRLKYANTPIDLVFATDNAALEFAVEYRKDLFSDAPMVFSGVTKDTASPILANTDNVVGVYEVLDPAGTLRAAAAINPGLRTVYVIFDNSKSGIDSKNLIVEGLRDSEYEIVFLNMLSIKEIFKRVSKLDDSSIILMGAYSSDVYGYKLPADKFSEQISNASAVPVYDLQTYRLGNGILGGHLLSGFETGRNAAELGIRLLNGDPVEKIDNVEKNLAAYIFDHKQLERFQIPLEKLPKGSMIINKPFSFYEAYRALVIGTVISFTVLLIFILVLLWHANKRKKAEMALIAANQELKALYEQMYAIDLQLKHQLEELSIAHKKLLASEEKYRMVAEATNDIIWDWDAEDNKIHYSGGLHQILGYDESEVSTKEDWMSLVIQDYTDQGEIEDIEHVLKNLRSPVSEYRVRHKTGKEVWISTRTKTLYDEFGKPEKIVGSHTDITQLKEYQNRIWEMAYYDALTKLPNRANLKEYIAGKIASCPNLSIAIIFIDIDNFKAINDSFGHTEGDKLLVRVGDMLSESMDEGCVVFRQSGDEFVVILDSVNQKSDITNYILKIKNRFDEPVSLTEGQFHITLSGGIVVYPGDGADFETLMKKADIALYHVKNTGKNNFIFFDSNMEKEAKEKTLLDYSLRAAVKKMDFVLYYQPIVDMYSGKITKFEALIRWRHSELGMIAPSVFIKLAEENGLIIPIGEWVIQESCSFAARLESIGLSDVSVSINISPVQLRHKDFVHTVKEAISGSGVLPERVEMEITESLLIDSPELSLKKLEEIKALGIRISLDDFGQGYSSLTYLRMLPIHTLKIDKAFLDNMSAKRNEQIICTIIKLAHGMGVEVVAEGVETKEQFRFLNESNCDLAQGYFISKPLPEEEALNLVRHNTVRSEKS